MSSPTMSQKLTAEAIGTAILVFIGAGSVPLTVFLTRLEPVRQRRAVDDLVLLRVRDLRRRLLGRPHQRLPHQPGRDHRPAGDPQDRLRGPPACYIVAQLDRRLRRRGPDLHHPDRQRPGEARPRRRLRQRRYAAASRSRFAAEAIGTAILVFTVFGAAVDGRAPAGFAGIIIGFIVYGIIILVGPITGAALNPAREIGPASSARPDRRHDDTGRAARRRLHRRPDRRRPRSAPSCTSSSATRRPPRCPARPSPRPPTPKPEPARTPRHDPEGAIPWHERTDPDEEAHQRRRGPRPGEPGRPRPAHPDIVKIDTGQPPRPARRRPEAGQGRPGLGRRLGPRAAPRRVRRSGHARRGRAPATSSPRRSPTRWRPRPGPSTAAPASSTSSRTTPATS